MNAPASAKTLAPFVRKLASRLVVVLGAVALLSYASRWVPREQTLVFELPARHLGAVRLSASWRRAGDREALGGTSWQLASAPNRLTHHVSLPDGDYVVGLELTPADISANASDGVQTSWERRVTLRAGEKVLVVAPDGP